LQLKDYRLFSIVTRFFPEFLIFLVLAHKTYFEAFYRFIDSVKKGKTKKKLICNCHRQANQGTFP
jgi:hypothetical protein